MPFYSGQEWGLFSEAQVNSAEIYYPLQGLHTTLEDGETEASSVCVWGGGGGFSLDHFDTTAEIGNMEPRSVCVTDAWPSGLPGGSFQRWAVL